MASEQALFETGAVEGFSEMVSGRYQGDAYIAGWRFGKDARRLARANGTPVEQATKKLAEEAGTAYKLYKEIPFMRGIIEAHRQKEIRRAEWRRDGMLPIEVSEGQWRTQGLAALFRR